MTAPYVFNTIQIHLFEYNIVPQLLWTPKTAIQNPVFGFLNKKAEYEQAQGENPSITSKYFVCNSFPRKILRDSSFWNRYLQTTSGQTSPYWKHQIPFILRLRRQALDVLAVPEQNRKDIRAESLVMINALGWSTHINLSVHIPLKPSQLADLCGNLRDKAFGAPAFSLNGTGMKLKEIFQYYRKCLMEDIFSPEVTYSRPSHIPHLVFVDVIQASGSPTQFYELPIPMIQALARIIRWTNPVVKLKEEGGCTFPVIDNMLITAIDPEFYNFSLSDFDQGSFTFLQADTLKDDSGGRPYCYSRNTRDAYLVTYSWLEAYRVLSEKAKKKASIQELIDNGRNALIELKTDYSSRTALRLWQKHQGLRNWLGLHEDEE